jgi:hypothetical protein
MRAKAAFRRVHKDILQNMDIDALRGAQRLELITKKAWQSLTDPANGENISNLGDLTSFYALARAKDRMM